MIYLVTAGVAIFALDRLDLFLCRSARLYGRRQRLSEGAKEFLVAMVLVAAGVSIVTGIFFGTDYLLTKGDPVKVKPSPAAKLHPDSRTNYYWR